jgi:hypothetical protein
MVTEVVTLDRDRSVTPGVTKRDRCDHVEPTRREKREEESLSSSLSVR